MAIPAAPWSPATQRGCPGETSGPHAHRAAGEAPLLARERDGAARRRAVLGVEHGLAVDGRHEPRASDSDNSPPGGWSTAGRSCRSARCSTPTCRRRCCGPWRPSSSRRTSAASAGSASRRRTAPGFDRRRYWRGPVWANLNWLLARGLRGHGLIAQAAALERTTLSLIERAGMRDYFDPITGDGLGSDDFSWTAAVAVDMLHA